MNRDPKTDHLVASRNTSTANGHPAVLFVVCAALFFGVVNGSAVAVVLPEIGADLAIGDDNLPWVLSGFLLTYGVAIPFYGRLASRYGARNLFLIGVTVFSIGSLLSAFATGLPTLLAARTVQAAGGAAVPGLGMTLASRAFPEERRGFVLGIVSATMGVGAAVGPLGAGVISELGSWRHLFAVSSLAILSVPLGLRFLDRTEERSQAPLDLAGGSLFGFGVASTLFFVTRGSQAGWTDSQTIAAAGLAVAALAVFAKRQGRSASPFIPRSLLANRQYLTLTVLGFVITFANLAIQIGLPFTFNALHEMSTLDIGIALIPAAMATAVVGVVAGRIVDRIGASLPIRAGASLMAVAVVAIASVVGSSVLAVAIIAAAFGAGFALVNTPLATVVSLIVDPDDLAVALSLNTMMFFIGGSFGATLFSSIVLGTSTDTDALNPLHDAVGPGFSNAFLIMVIPVLVGLLLSRGLPRRDSSTSAGTDTEAHADTETQTDVRDGAQTERMWTANCEMPWSPEIKSEAISNPTGATHV